MSFSSQLWRCEARLHMSCNNVCTHIQYTVHACACDVTSYVTLIALDDSMTILVKRWSMKTAHLITEVYNLSCRSIIIIVKFTVILFARGDKR